MLVRKGDVCFVDNGTINQKTKERLLGDHAFMIAIAQDGELKKDTPTVHLTWGGLEIWPFEHQGARPDYLFRCPNADLARKATEYALGWAKIVPSTVRNTYHHSRAKAVMHDVCSGGDLPFGFDALRRAIKWSRRDESPFSASKGLSCCAFVIACYQAAAFSEINVTAEKRAKAWEKLESLRVPKADFRSARTVHQPDYREYANPGAKEADAVTQVLACMKGSEETDNAFLERIMTWPMVVDARFLHSDGLIRRLQDQRSNWAQVTKGQAKWPI